MTSEIETLETLENNFSSMFKDYDFCSFDYVKSISNDTDNS